MEKVAKKILDDAEKEREQTVRDGEAAVADIRKRHQEEFQKLTKGIEAEVREALETEKKRILGMTKLSVRNELLITRRQILDSLFDDALESLVSKPEDEYLGLVSKLLSLTEVKDGELVLGHKEERIGQQFLSKVNSELSANFVLSSDQRDIRGGFILSRGQIEIDCSFNAILNVGRERIELELAKLVF
jgi:V/A-type H+-transporting ATPase subunit E